MAGLRELEVVRLGYMVEEPLDDEVLGDIILSVDHEGGDVDVGKSVVDIPSRESGSPGVHAIRKERGTTKYDGSHVNGNRWVREEIIERGVQWYWPRSLIASVLPEEPPQCSPIHEWIAEPSKYTLLNILWERRQQR